VFPFTLKHTAPWSLTSFYFQDAQTHAAPRISQTTHDRHRTGTRRHPDCRHTASTSHWCTGARHTVLTANSIAHHTPHTYCARSSKAPRGLSTGSGSSHHTSIMQRTRHPLHRPARIVAPYSDSSTRRPSHRHRHIRARPSLAHVTLTYIVACARVPAAGAQRRSSTHDPRSVAQTDCEILSRASTERVLALALEVAGTCRRPGMESCLLRYQ